MMSSRVGFVRERSPGANSAIYPYTTQTFGSEGPLS